MKDKITEEIAIGSFWNFLLTFSARIGSLFFVIITARFLLPESFGIYNLTVSIALILLITIDAGINQALLKYVSSALKNNNKELAAANFRYLFKLKIFITVLLSFFLIILAYPLSYYIFRKPALFIPIIFSSFYILANSIGSFYSSYFYIIKKLGYVTIKQVIFEILRIIGVLAVFLIIAKEYYVIGTIGILTITMFFSTLYILYVLKKLNPFLFQNPNKEDKEVDKKRIIKFSIYSGAIGSLLIIFGFIDTIMIGIFLEASYVGYYNAALAIVTGIWGFLNLSQILLPIFSELNDAQIKKEFNKIFKYLTMLAIPAIFGILVLGKYFIRLIYGYEYLPAVNAFYVLSILILHIPLIDLITPLFFAKEKQKIIIKSLILSTIINVVLNFIFIIYLMRISMELAIVGAAFASLISQTFYLLTLLIFSKKKWGISMNFSYLIKPVIASLIMSLILILINSKIADVNLFIGVGEIFIGIIIYFLLMIILKGISKEDFSLLKDVTKNFLK